MNQFLHGVAHATAETFDFPGPVLEIGSYRVPGQEALADLRPFFPHQDYVGLDARPGPGVDEVGDVEDLPYPDRSIGTVLAFSTFEHVPHFWKGFEEVRRVLRPDGALVVACPFYFHVHAHPHDYWRFTPEALELLLEPYPSKVIGWHGPPSRPLNVWAVAFGEDWPVLSHRDLARYRDLMRRYAHEPLPWNRRLRYLVGRLLCGRRPFGPWLERNNWDCRYLHRPRLPRSEHARSHAARRLPAKG
jgi:SAM-dependent methyltransferase